MTPSQQNLRARILALRITIGEASSDLEDALAECNHESRSKKANHVFVISAITDLVGGATTHPIEFVTMVTKLKMSMEN